MTPSGRPLFQKILAVLGVITCVAVLGLAVFAERLQRWARHELVDLYLDEIRPLLPFDIASVQYEAGWRDLIAGRVPRLTLNLKSRPSPDGKKTVAWDARVSGPLDISRRPGRVHIVYEPQIFLHLTAPPQDNTLNARIEVELDRHPGRNPKGGNFALLAASLDLSASQLKWPDPQVELKTVKFGAKWDQARDAGRAAADFSFGSASFSPPGTGGSTRVIQLTGGELTARTPLALSPVRVGPEIAIELRGKGAEIAWDSEYLDAPWAALPLRAKLKLDEHHRPRSASLTLGPASEFEARAVLGQAHGATVGARTVVSWKSAALELPTFVNALKKATGPTGVGEIFQRWAARIQVLAGTLSTEGRATLAPGKSPDVRGSLRVRDAGLRWPDATFAAHGVSLELPFALRGGQPELAGELRADQLAFRRLRAQLGTTSLSLRQGTVRLSGPKSSPALPLKIEGLDGPGELSGAVIGAVSGKLHPTMALRTSFHLAEIPIERILDAVCIKKGRLPPATVSAALSAIDFSGDDLDLTGELAAKLFEGTFRINEMGAFNLHSDVPEIDFGAELKGVRLDLLGEWLGFGAMRGTLEAYAHDVTTQGWLPTRYDFSIDAKPMPGGGWVDFSPGALKNLIELFAADSMDSIPGIAQWVAFGAPSHLLGGYDVKYAGISLFSSDGVTLMESHDVPEVLHWKKKRYVIWGRRFAMPMPLGSHYPLVVDATAMGNLFRHMVHNIQELSRAKQEQDALAAKALDQVFKKSILPLGAQTYDDQLPEDCRPQ